jgi:predicted 2-oxoglutarate/Fe(II)-dependent dioxygenase YbiX
MLYEAGNWLRNHLDSPKNEHEGDSTHSLNIMLSEKESFTGGSFLIGNEQRQIIELDQGDAVLYDYSHMHEVKKIKSGERWIINVRLLS